MAQSRTTLSFGRSQLPTLLVHRVIGTFLGNLALQAHRPPESEIIHTMVILTVDDLDSAISAVEQAGGRLGERHDNEHAPVIVAHVLDTEGNVIQLAQTKT